MRMHFPPPHSLPLLPMAAALLLAGCGESGPPRDNPGGSTTPRYDRMEEGSLLGDTTTPVRIGDLGPNFPACNARGSTRDRAAGGPVPVRAAPFEQAGEVDRLPLGSEFFICTRSHDQRWFGIVYGEAGRASEACGVSAPVADRREYEGPCSSGWVPSALVRLVSGVPQAGPALPVGDSGLDPVAPNR